MSNLGTEEGLSISWVWSCAPRDRPGAAAIPFGSRAFPAVFGQINHMDRKGQELDGRDGRREILKLERAQAGLEFKSTRRFWVYFSVLRFILTCFIFLSLFWLCPGIS